MRADPEPGLCPGRWQADPTDTDWARAAHRTVGVGRLNEPSRDDGVVEALSEVVGGPVGDRARRGSWWTPVRIMLAVFSVVFMLSVAQHYPCGETNWSRDSVRFGKMCYSDVPYLYTARGFAEQKWPYGESQGDGTSADPGRYPAMEYPPVISYFAWTASKVTALMPSGPSEAVRANTTTGALWGLPGMTKEVNTYFLVTAVMLFVFGLGSVYFLSGASPGRPWDAMGLALSPALLASALVNWDLLAVFFTAGALWAWARGKPGLAGVMVGIGFATKLYPLFLLGAFLVDAVRRRRPERIALAIFTAVAAWVVVNLPALLGNASAWKLFWTFNSHRGADLGSFWYVLADRGHHVSTHTINVVSGVFFVVACAAILALGLAARKRPQVAQIAFLIVLAFLLVNKVYSPQYVLWLLPLAVLARPRWRDLLIWQACEVLYFVAVWFYLGGWLASSSTGAPATAYHLAIVVRMLGELYLAAWIVRDIWTAEPDLNDLTDLDDLDGVALPDLDGVALPDLDGVALPDLDGVEDGRREPHPHVDGRAHVGNLRA